MKDIYEGKTPPFPTYDVYRSENDNSIVISIENIPENENGPIIRVYLNDELLFAKFLLSCPSLTSLRE